MHIQEIDKTYVANTYDRYEPVFVSGKGSLVYDDTGKEYIDLASGIAVNCFGVADDAWIAAVTAQLGKLQHLCNKYYTAPQAMLAQKLCERTGMKKVFFANSGAEANECLIKVARKYGHDHHGANCSNIITLTNSFHGRTMATLTACGQKAMHKDFGPFVPGFLYANANDFASVAALADENTCGILMEMVQGEGGVNALDAEFVHQVASLCKQKDILLLVDEVQTGNGRTGKLYAYMHFGVEPDVVSTAKGIGGGLPLGVCMMGAKTADTLTAGTHGSTFGGNPVCCAGALSILDRLDDKLLADVARKGDFIKETLSACKGVSGVSGMGLMIGVALADKKASDVAHACLDAGVMVMTAKDKLRILPALNIPDELLKKAIDIMKGIIEA